MVVGAERGQLMLVSEPRAAAIILVVTVVNDLDRSGTHSSSSKFHVSSWTLSRKQGGVLVRGDDGLKAWNAPMTGNSGFAHKE